MKPRGGDNWQMNDSLFGRRGSRKSGSPLPEEKENFNYLNSLGRLASKRAPDKPASPLQEQSRNVRTPSQHHHRGHSNPPEDDSSLLSSMKNRKKTGSVLQRDDSRGISGNAIGTHSPNTAKMIYKVIASRNKKEGDDSTTMRKQRGSEFPREDFKEFMKNFEGGPKPRQDKSSRTLEGPPVQANSTVSYLLNSKKFKVQLIKRNGLLTTSSCINHPKIKSQFYVVEDHKVVELDESCNFLRGICSKCAVKLANHGIKVEEIPGDEEEEKKILFDEFISKVSGVQLLNKRAKRIVERKQDTFEDLLAQESRDIKMLEANVDKFIELLKKNKMLIRKVFEEEARREKEKLHNMAITLSENDKELKYFLKNMESNYERTVSQTTFQTMARNIQKFEEQLELIAENCRRNVEIEISMCQANKAHIQVLAKTEDYLRDLFMLQSKSLKITEQNLQEKFMHEYRGLFEQGKTDQSSNEQQSSDNNFLDNTKSNFYLSFEKSNNESSISVFNESRGPEKGSPKSTHPYKEILERIKENQSEKSQFYSTIIKNENQPMFIVSPPEGHLDEKQTPELGQKGQTPEYLKEHLLQMKRQVDKHHVESKEGGLRRFPAFDPACLLLDPAEFCDSNEKEQKWASPKCQKILFREE
jgi:hypothetical protein